MISVQQYFAKPHTPAQRAAAIDLIRRRNALREEYYAATGRAGPDIDPDTGTEISGKKGGTGGGGFRLEGEEGSKYSSHKIGAGIDDYDPHDDFDDWLSLFDREGGRFNEKLEKHGLYREHPSATPTWAHLTTRAPASGKRTFFP
jgi:hypothetical protein